jgi:hypothetical protein
MIIFAVAVVFRGARDVLARAITKFNAKPAVRAAV